MTFTYEVEQEDDGQWPSVRASVLLSALMRIGWVLERQRGLFHDGEEIGPRMVARVAKHTGLTPNDL